MSRGYAYDDEDDYVPRPKGKAAPKAPPSRVARAYESDSESDNERDREVAARAVRRQESSRSNYDSREDHSRRDGRSNDGTRGFVPKGASSYNDRDDDDDYYRRGGKGRPTGTGGGDGWKTAGNRDELAEQGNSRARDYDRDRNPDYDRDNSRRGPDSRRRGWGDEEEQEAPRRTGWQAASAKPREDAVEPRERSNAAAAKPKNRAMHEEEGDDDIEERLGKPDFEDDDVAVPHRRSPNTINTAQSRMMQPENSDDEEFNRKYGVTKTNNRYEPADTQRKPFNLAANKPNDVFDTRDTYTKYGGTPDPSQLGSFSPSPISLVNIAPRSSVLVKCTIIREKESFNPLNMTKFYPSYQLVLEETNKVILLAKKMNMNRTSNYHMFDMTRGQVSTNLTKKSGNYIGKLRATNYQRSEYVLVTPNAEVREEVGAIIFDRYGLYDQLTEGTQPRKISVIVPALDADSCPIPHEPLRAKELISKTSSSRGKAQSPKQKVETDGEGYSLVDMLRSSDYTNCHVFESKDPMYEKGNYRLNFNGRVTVASVKNFQLVPPTNNNNVTVQFGKVGSDHFHLDYKAPLNAVQAFSLALCQFNI